MALNIESFISRNRGDRRIERNGRKNTNWWPAIIPTSNNLSQIIFQYFFFGFKIQPNTQPSSPIGIEKKLNWIIDIANKLTHDTSLTFTLTFSQLFDSWPNLRIARFFKEATVLIFTHAFIHWKRPKFVRHIDYHRKLGIRELPESLQHCFVCVPIQRIWMHFVCLCGNNVDRTMWHEWQTLQNSTFEMVCARLCN